MVERDAIVSSPEHDLPVADGRNPVPLQLHMKSPSSGGKVTHTPGSQDAKSEQKSISSGGSGGGLFSSGISTKRKI